MLRGAYGGTQWYTVLHGVHSGTQCYRVLHGGTWWYTWYMVIHGDTQWYRHRAGASQITAENPMYAWVARSCAMFVMHRHLDINMY